VSYSILQGDVIEVLRTMPAASVHCVVTSPPYFSLRKYGDDSRELGQEASPQEFVANMVAVFDEVRRVLRPDGVCWVNIADSYGGSWGNYSGQNRGAGTQRPIENGSRVPRRGDGPQTETWRPATSQLGGGVKNKERCAVPERLVLAMSDAGWWYRDEVIWHKPNPMTFSGRDRTTPAHEKVYMFTQAAHYFYDQEAIREPIKASSIARLGQPSLDDQVGSTRANGGAKTNGNMKPVLFGGQKYRDGHTKSGNEWRPQLKRALELAREGGLTDAHLAAIRAVGLNDVGRAAETQSGAGRNTEEVQRLAAEAKEVLGGYFREFLTSGGANRRSVWTIATGNFREAHFATMPEALAVDMIKAGTSARGCCPGCGSPWQREVEPVFTSHDADTDSAYEKGSNANRLARLRQAARAAGGEYVNERITTAWTPTCECGVADPIPCTVLDIFNGAGTTGVAALGLGRSYVGIELYPEYVEMSERRLAAVQPVLSLGI
jgi:DNA modification methylase